METNCKQFGLLIRFDEYGISFLIGSQFFSDSFDYNKCLEPDFIFVVVLYLAISK